MRNLTLADVIDLLTHARANPQLVGKYNLVVFVPVVVTSMVDALRDVERERADLAQQLAIARSVAQRSHS